MTTRYGRRMTTTWHSLHGWVADCNARIEETVGGIRHVQAATITDAYRICVIDRGRVVEQGTINNYCRKRGSIGGYILPGTTRRRRRAREARHRSDRSQPPARRQS
jgi:ABC-type multidrug transport system ATPase subunit